MAAQKRAIQPPTTDGGTSSRKKVRRKPVTGTSKKNTIRKTPSAYQMKKFGFVARLEIETDNCPIRDKKKIEISGLAKPVKSHKKDKIPCLRDMEKVAKRVSKGFDADSMAAILAAMGHVQRLRIMLKLLGGDATHKLLSKETGLKPGPLYHHIRELRSAGMIGPKIRDLYTLSDTGRRVLLTILAMWKACK